MNTSEIILGEMSPLSKNDFKDEKMDNRLHLVTSVFNAQGFKRRYELYWEFVKRMEKTDGVVLHTVECAYGDKPFVVTEADNPNHIQVRTNDVWFIKENLLNLGFRSLDKSVQYCAWIDADISFANPNWVEETIEALHGYPIVQPFSQIHHLNPDMEPFQIWNGFAHSYTKDAEYNLCGKKPYDRHWHPGFAWAYRKEALDAIGGLMDRTLLGSADSHMAAAYINQCANTIHKQTTDEFKAYVYNYENVVQRYLTSIGASIGFVKGAISHYWHGSMSDRGYIRKWDVLIDNGFNPYTDLVPDLNGLLHIANKSPKLRRDCIRYFSQRNEDSIEFNPAESTIKMVWEGNNLPTGNVHPLKFEGNEEPLKLGATRTIPSYMQLGVYGDGEGTKFLCDTSPHASWVSLP